MVDQKMKFIILKKIGIVAGIVILVLLSTIFVSDGIFLKKKYLEPWNTSYYEQFEDPRMQIIAHGLLAPNSHNLQPWKITLDDENAHKFRLFVNSERISPEVDPFHRQLMITQGTFIEYMRIAATKLGYNLTWVLFPEGEIPWNPTLEELGNTPVANLYIEEFENMLDNSASESSLYLNMFKPDTYRVAYLNKSIETNHKTILDSVSLSGCDVSFFDDDDELENIGKIIYDAAEIESNITRIFEESANLMRKTEWEKNKIRYGFSLEGGGNQGLGLHFTQGILGIFPGMNSESSNRDVFLNQIQTAAENSPAYFMIKTANNTRIEQVEAGILFSRILLTSANLGLVLQPISQALQEYPEMQEIYENIHDEYTQDGEIIQMLVRIGYTEKTTLQTMRLDATDLIA